MNLKKINETTYDVGKIDHWSSLPKTIKRGKSTYSKVDMGCSNGKYCNEMISKFKSGGKSAFKLRFTDNFGTRYQVYVKRGKGGSVPTAGTVKLVRDGYQDGEWASQFYVWVFRVDSEEVSVERDLVNKGTWYVIWDGDLDYEGNKRDLVKQYPEFRKYLG